MKLLIDCTSKTERLSPEIKSALIANTQEQINNGQDEKSASVASVQQFLDMTRSNINALEKALKPEVSKETGQYQLPEIKQEGPIEEGDLPWTTKRIAGESAENNAVINLDTGQIGTGETLDEAYKDAGVNYDKETDEADTPSVSGYVTDEGRFSDGTGNYVPLNKDQTSVRFATKPPTRTTEKTEEPGARDRSIRRVLPVGIFKGEIDFSPSRLWASTADVLRGMKKWPNAVTLGKAMLKHADDQRKYRGRFLTPLERLGKVNDDVIEDYRSKAFFGEEKEAKKVYDSADENTKKAIDLMAKQYDQREDLSLAIGMKETDSKGNKRPKKKSTVPIAARIKESFRLTLENKAHHPKEWAKLVKDLLNEGKIKDSSEADQYRQDALEMLKKGAGNLEIPSGSEKMFPRSAYDFSRPGFVDETKAWAKRQSREENFGAKTGPEGKDLWDEVIDEAEDTHTKNYIKGVRKSIMGSERDASVFAKGAAIASNVATGMHLADPDASWRNLISSVIASTGRYGKFNPFRVIPALAKSFSRIEAREKGIIESDMINLTRDSQEVSKTGAVEGTRKVVSGALKVGLKDISEDISRVYNFNLVRAELREILKSYKRNSNSMRSRNNSARIQRLGIEPHALMLEDGDGELTDRYYREAVNQLQGGYGPEQLPALASTPQGRFLFKYQPFMLQMQRFIAQELVRPAVQGVTGGRVLREDVRVKNPKTGEMETRRVPGTISPLVNFAIIAAIGSMTADELRKWLLGIRDNGPTFGEIFAKYDQGENGKAAQLLWNKLVFHMTNSGLTGMITKGYQGVEKFAKTGEIPNPIEDTAAMAPINAIKELVQRTVEQKSLSAIPGDVWDIARKEIKGVKTVGRIAKRINDAFGTDFRLGQVQERRDNMTFMRGVERRFAEDTGLQLKPDTEYHRAAKKEDSQDKAELREALELGNAEKAQEVIDRMKKDIDDPKKEEEFDKKLRKTVQGWRPIRVEGRNTDAMAVAFKQWTETNLSPADQEMIKQLDDTFRDTAVTVRILEPVDVSPADVDEAIEKARIKDLKEE